MYLLYFYTSLPPPPFPLLPFLSPFPLSLPLLLPPFPVTLPSLSPSPSSCLHAHTHNLFQLVRLRGYLLNLVGRQTRRRASWLITQTIRHHG